MDDFRSPDDLFREEAQKIKNMGKDFSKFLPLLIAGLFILFLLQGSIYSIGPDEVGVVQRFGRYTRTTEPGLHLKIPFGIEKATPVKIKKVFKEEFGFRTARPGVRSVYASKQYPEESLMLTGDLNILDVRWAVQFSIKDPMEFLFNTRNPVENIRAMSEVVIRRLCGDYSVDEVLTIEREGVAFKARDDLQALLDRYQTGVYVVTVQLLDVNPPEQVKPAFNEVNESKQERERMINQAWEEYNKVIPRAMGEAKRTISQAEGYKIDRVNRARGDASRFFATWQEYKKAPDVTRQRLYLERMSEVLSKADKKYIVDPQQSSILQMLRLDGTGEGKQ